MGTHLASNVWIPGQVPAWASPCTTRQAANAFQPPWNFENQTFFLLHKPPSLHLQERVSKGSTKRMSYSYQGLNSCTGGSGFALRSLGHGFKSVHYASTLKWLRKNTRGNRHRHVVEPKRRIKVFRSPVSLSLFSKLLFVNYLYIHAEGIHNTYKRMRYESETRK